MGEAQEVQLQVDDHEAKEQNSPASTSSISNQPMAPQPRSYKWWIHVSIFTIFVLFGQSVALLLGRLYFLKGGNSKWMETLVQLAGFPILIPCYFFTKINKPSGNDATNIKPASPLTLALVYLTLGLIVAADCFLYSVGLQYLPASTYTLVSASQLAFNSLFSFFLNGQKFTPLIVNSLVLLTISSVLLVFNNESEGPTGISKVKYAIGFVCTVAASAGYGLVLSLTQVCFKKVIKRQTFEAVMDMIIYQGAVATGATVVGLFASGEWSDLTREMNDYQLGKISYVMTLTWTSIAWAVFSIGCVGLIFEVSSLFSNAINVLGLSIVPILAVFLFHDKMDGIKAISMVLAVWGFASYVYQHYLDGKNSSAQDQVTKLSMIEMQPEE